MSELLDVGKPPEIVQAPCNRCMHETRHVVLARRELTRRPIVNRPGWMRVYEMIECCGCEEVIFRIRYWEEDWIQYDPVTDEKCVQENVRYFPPVVSRAVPGWVRGLRRRRKHLAALLEEVYGAIDSESFCLAAMGARAALDVVMIEAVGDVGGFTKKLEALVDTDLIVPDEKTILEAALGVGNAASHRGHRPRATEIATVMDIVENLFMRIYILPVEAAKLKSRTPRRSAPSPGN